MSDPSLEPVLDVLIVEDDSVLCRTLIHVARKKNLSVDCAGDVTEAKRLLSRKDYRTLILDLMLPDGTAYDILDFMKSGELPTMNVLVITAAEPAALTKLDRTVVKTVMFKPLNLEHFGAYIHMVSFNPPG